MGGPRSSFHPDERMHRSPAIADLRDTQIRCEHRRVRKVTLKRADASGSYGLFPFPYLERAGRMVRGNVTQVENQNGLRNTRRSRQVGFERVHVRSQAASPCTELLCVRALRALARQSRSDR